MTFNFSPIFLALNETLLGDSISDNELIIQDYNLIRKDRNRNGGGVAIYIRNSISYDLINSVVLDSLELLLIRVRPKSATPFLFDIALRIVKLKSWINMKIH